MAAEPLGAARCPLCGGTARVSLSKSKYAVMTMNCCNAQLFTRSPRSDELVRDMIKPAAAAPADPVHTEKPDRPVTEKPTAAPAPKQKEPTPQPPAPGGFGLMKSWL